MLYDSSMTALSQGTAGPHPACTSHHHTCSLDHVAPTCHGVTLAILTTSHLQSKPHPARTRYLHNHNLDQVPPVCSVATLTIKISSLDTALLHLQSRLTPTYLMYFKPAGGTTSHRCALLSHLQPSPDPTYAFLPPHLQSPLHLSQHLSAAPSSPRSWRGPSSLHSNPVSPAGTWGEPWGGCPAGLPSRESVRIQPNFSRPRRPSSHDRPRRSSALPRRPPAGWGGGRRGAVRRPATLRRRPQPPGSARPQEPRPVPGRSAGGAAGADRPRRGSFSPPGEGSCRAAPAWAPCRRCPGQQPWSVLPGSPRQMSSPEEEPYPEPTCCAPLAARGSPSVPLPPVARGHLGGMRCLLPRQEASHSCSLLRRVVPLCPATGAFIHGPGLGSEWGLRKAGDRLPGRPEDPAPCSISASFSTSLEKRRGLPLPLGERVSSTDEQ